MPHSGNCFRGTVKLEVTGSPEAMGYCHCGSCRSWSGGPVNAFTLWKPEAVRITSGADCVETKLYNVCPNCGGGFVPRPIRPATEWRPELCVAKRPPSGTRVHLSHGLSEIAEFVRTVRDVPPSER